MQKKEAVIYGVRTGDTYHYVGKTIEKVKANGRLNNSDAKRQYHKKSIRKVFVENQNAEVVPIKTVDNQDWYDEKLVEVVAKYGESHPLLNAQWMLDGKRGFWEGTQGYWQGKERDAHTLQRLSESKFKRVVQYDKEGSLVKVWKSGKEVAEKVFGDYRVVNGAGETSFYDVLNSRTMKTRLRYNSYWFWEKHLLEYFGTIPTRLNLGLIYAEEQKVRSECMKKIRALRKNLGQRRYTVIHYNKDGSIKTTYDNTSHAAYMIRTSIKTIMRLCNGILINDNYILRYGEKTTQPMNLVYPRYKARGLKSTVVRVSKAKPYLHTRTRYGVNQYEGNVIIQTYESIEDCADKLKLKPSTVRRLCRNEMRLDYNNYPVLRLGEKRTVVVEK